MNPKQSSDLTAMNEDDFVKAVNHALDHGYGPRPKSSFPNGSDRFSLFGGNLTMSTNESFEVPPKVIKLASKRTAFPLSLMHANDYAAKRIVLIGDAAHAVHPLAGQGVNLGFGDAFTLSRIISEGVAVGMDVGEVHNNGRMISLSILLRIMLVPLRFVRLIPGCYMCRCPC
ncbi:Ubiquinone biosynthesis monooxygenase COQ6, mitochondrial [Linum perenne]